jgi:hypothetical protein
MRKPVKPTCPKCKSMVRDMFGDKKFMPRWKTIVKGIAYACRNCGWEVWREGRLIRLGEERLRRKNERSTLE